MTLLWGSTLVIWKQGSRRVREEMKAPLFQLRDLPCSLRTEEISTLLLQGPSHEFSIAKYLSVFYSVYRHISESTELTQSNGMMDWGLCFWTKTCLKEWADGFLFTSPEKPSEIAAKRVKLGQISASNPFHFLQSGDIEEYECLWESGTQQSNRVLESRNWRWC